MENNNDKIYCGNGKIINGQYGQFIAVNLEVDKLLQHCVTAQNGKRYINLNISDRKNPDSYGNTKKVVVNKPPTQKTQVTQTQHSPDRFDVF